VPISGDFFMYGGLYRPVSLITVGEAHVALLDYASPGVFERIDHLDDRSAQVSIRSEIRNDGARRGRFVVETTVRDATGKAVASDRQLLTVEGRQQQDSVATLTIADPRRWQGRSDPYLYRTTVEVRSAAGALLDRVEQPLGLRTIRIDPDRGFFLNGRHVALHGVAMHQDREDAGWALSPADYAQDMRMVEELGANTIRLAHYDHAQPVYDLADRDGIILWAELGVVNLTAPPGVRDTPPAMMASAREQLRELIRQNYNHPSVALWSIGNEVTNWSSKGLTPGNARPMMTALDKLAKAEDPTRATTIGVCCEPLPGEPDKGQDRTSGTADTAGYNLYLGWYSTGHVEDAARLGDVLRGLHEQHPGLPIALSEYGAGGAVTQHTDDVRGGKLESIYRPQPEEAETAIHALSWQAIEPLDFLWGTYVWQMFDSTSALREEGDSSDINTKGLVTFDRKTRKDAYYFYQAAWRADVPVLHLAGRHYVDRAYRVTDVRAFSNASSAELSVNGEPVGRAACRNHICTWPKVRLAMGWNQLAATATWHDRPMRDEIAWEYRGPGDALHIRAGSLTGTVRADGTRYGSDAYFTGGTGNTLNPYRRELYAATSGNSAPHKTVTGTADPDLYASWRAGEHFSYSLPLPDGRYRVTVHLFEPEGLSAGARVFSVAVSGGDRRDGIDPAKLAGGALRATTVSLNGVVRGGVLTLTFDASRGEALVSAIDATPLP
jgi:beta-galactosidase